MKQVYYDVYDGDTLYLQCVTRNEINKALNLNKASLTSYIDNEWKIQGRYTLVVVSDRKRITEKMPYTFAQDWEEAVKPFKRVIWCKTEGKKLYAGKGGAR